MLKIIIADDHTIFRQGLIFLFKKAGIKVIAETENGKEAVEKTLKLQPDILIMDISMPELDGLQAARLIEKTSTAGKNNSFDHAPRCPICQICPQTRNIWICLKRKCLCRSSPSD